MPAFPPEPSPWDAAFPPHSQALSPSTDPKTRGNESSTARDSRAFVTAPDELQIQQELLPCTWTLCELGVKAPSRHAARSEQAGIL